MSNPPRFSLEDPLSNAEITALPGDMILNVIPLNYRYALIRLLTGTLNLRCNYNNVLLKQRINLAKIPPHKNSRVTCRIFEKATTSSLNDLNSFLLKSKTNNIKFYREIFFEYSNYFLRRKEKNETVAFLHLYRILESIAYCFPLVWASRAKNFEGTFGKLKSYFNGQNTGELKVFRLFINDIINPLILNSLVDFEIKSIHVDWQERYFDSIFNNIQDNNDIVSFTRYSVIKVKYRCLTDLMITLRNKYFHFRTGQGRNLCSENIVETNEFFSIINENIANWLTLIMFEILDYEMDL